MKTNATSSLIKEVQENLTFKGSEMINKHPWFKLTSKKEWKVPFEFGFNDLLEKTDVYLNIFAKEDGKDAELFNGITRETIVDMVNSEMEANPIKDCVLIKSPTMRIKNNGRVALVVTLKTNGMTEKDKGKLISDKMNELFSKFSPLLAI